MIVMEHSGAVAFMAVESYHLGILPARLVVPFELHLFECEACAAELRALDALAANVRAVLLDPLR
jgi:hypothetical protein